MFRGEDDIEWILYQRKQLGQEHFLEKLQSTIADFNPRLAYGQPLSHQGLGSLEFAELSEVLQPLFPSLAPQDFYRFKTIDQLTAHFGAPKQAGPERREAQRDHQVVISGMSCRLPASVETPAQFWDTLLSRQDQVQRVDGRGNAEGGFLSASVSRFDHRYFGISQAEARTMDPQQILALELTEMLFRDAGIDPETLDKNRVGVYIGVWNQEYWGDKASVFLPTGTNPSIIASRISYHYDLRGPSWVSNTACSSSLVAVHYAVKDIEAGRVDYAVAGGVNMLLDEGFSGKMRNSGFLSRDDRCKTFDNAANGYVRAEGGGLVLLVNKTLADTYYAEVSGSAINQNGRRSQVITAPHPEAQGELILSACRDAGIRPAQIAYVECHGTGTKIGDPIEISALKDTVARDRKNICHIGSVKSNLGHLESAAGIAGLIKSLAVLNHGVIPPNLHFRTPNEYIDFKSHHLRVVTEETRIDPLAHIGISSFGFGGSNAHIIVKGVDAAVRKKIKPGKVPFDRERAVPLGHYLRLLEPEAASPPVDRSASVETPADPEGTWPAMKASGDGSDNQPEEAVTRDAVDKMFGQLIFELANIEKIDPDVELIDQGLDSLSGTELISQLEILLGVEISPDLLLENPLPTQFVDQVYALAAGLRN
jgi:phthiocerol/phenolphthiocerol synthesis type-I polyketide synthase D